MIRTRKKTIVPRSADADRTTCEALARDDIIFALGPAGTGKTYVAVAQAVQQLMHRQRPAPDPVAPRGRGGRAARLPARRHEGEGRSLSPPALRRALRHACRPSRSSGGSRRGEIEIAPIAFMRGRTLADAFIILDEAQNTTPAQMKMFLTRFGQNSRMVVCGDPKQIDLPGGAQVGPGRRGRPAGGHRGHVDDPLRRRATSCATRSSAGSSRPMRARMRKMTYRPSPRRGEG